MPSLLFVGMQTEVERAPSLINTPIIKITGLGLVGEVVSVTVDQPPVPTQTANATATCTARNFAT